MNKKDIKKIVLAYSGGLDTSIFITWIKENYNDQKHFRHFVDQNRPDPNWSE